MTPTGRIRLLAVVAVVALGYALAPVAARADETQQSIFQDDQYLLYAHSAKVEHTLELLSSLGVSTVRVNVVWSTLAPDPLSRKAPAGFNGIDPADYPAPDWAPYDRLVRDAQALGMGVDFNITAPGPLWAMARGAPVAKAANHWSPNGIDFIDFVYALGTRYDGKYTPPGSATPLPYVDYWSIWNEPNQPGWLAPQWRRFDGKEVMNSPRLYREYADYGFLGLAYSGHAGDTILIGELAPEGFTTPGYYTATTPMPFMQALYCVDSRYRRLTGKAAEALGCPTTGTAQDFIDTNLALFYATGFAHHPYYFHYKPTYSSPNPDYVPLSDLGRLENGLDRAFAAYGMKRRIPIYITEYGYSTNPPNPRENVTPAEQAEYLNEADYMAWRNPRVRSVAQFLLYDSPPDKSYKKTNPKYWDTFQTGLLYVNGKPKPSLTAYRTPIWIPSPGFRHGSRTFIWGQIRPGPHTGVEHALIQWRGTAHGAAWRTVSKVAFEQPEGYFTARVGLPGTGAVRITWTTANRRHTYYSRLVAVTEG